MKPFITFWLYDSTPILVFSKDQLDEINLTPGKFVDELDSLLEADVIGYAVQKQYLYEAGNLQTRTLVTVEFKFGFGDNFEESDAENILDQYRFIINKYYKNM